MSLWSPGSVIRAWYVCPLQIIWVSQCSIQWIVNERQRVGIKASLTCSLARRYGACLECKMAPVVSGENGLKLNDTPHVLSSLDDRRKCASSSIEWEVIIATPMNQSSVRL